MHSVVLAIDGEERTVVSIIVAEELITANLVGVQANRRSQRRHSPARGEDCRQHLCYPIFERDDGPGEDDLRDQDNWHKADGAVIVWRNGRNSQADHQTGQRCQGQRDIGFQQRRQEDALLQRLAYLHHQRQYRALEEAEDAQHHNLGEHIRENAEIDRSLPPVDRGLFDNLARPVDAAEEYRREGHDEQHFLRVRAGSRHEKVLQRLIRPALLAREGLSGGIGFQERQHLLAIDLFHLLRLWQRQGTRRGEDLRATLHQAIGIKNARPHLETHHQYQHGSDNRSLQEQNEQIAFVVLEQFQVTDGEQQELRPGIAALHPFLRFLRRLPDAPRLPPLLH